MYGEWAFWGSGTCIKISYNNMWYTDSDKLFRQLVLHLLIKHIGKQWHEETLKRWGNLKRKLRKELNRNIVADVCVCSNRNGRTCSQVILFTSNFLHPTLELVSGEKGSLLHEISCFNIVYGTYMRYRYRNYTGMSL